MSTHATKLMDPAKSAIDVATPAVPTDITQPTGIASTADAPVRRKSGVERYFRKARDRALREATVAVDAPADSGCANASAGKMDAGKRALQAAENEGWKYRVCDTLGGSDGG